MPEFFQEAFEDLGSSLEAEGIELIKCEPNYLVWFHDGHSFQLSSDLARMKPEIEKWEGKDGFLRYLKFLEESHQHYEISGTQVLHRNFTSLLSLLRVNFLFYFFNLHVLESVYTRASRYFKTDRLRRVFTFGSMYMGMSPFDAPGTYSLLQYAELAQGIWYPKGGFFKVWLRQGWTFGQADFTISRSRQVWLKCATDSALNFVYVRTYRQSIFHTVIRKLKESHWRLVKHSRRTLLFAMLTLSTLTTTSFRRQNMRNG